MKEQAIVTQNHFAKRSLDPNSSGDLTASLFSGIILWVTPLEVIVEGFLLKGLLYGMKGA